MTSYVVAATPRCGGNLLCETLFATGLAGNPAEFFEPASRLAVHAAEVGLATAAAAKRDLPAYAAALRRHYSSSNGVLGVKLHWDQVEWLRAQGTSVEALLGPCRYVHLTRGDITRQAISLVRATQTRAWNSLETPRREPIFDPGGIRDMITLLVRANASWESFFAAQPYEPLRVTYETFFPERAAGANAVLAFLGVPHDPAEVERRISETPCRLARQADAVTADWLRLWVDYLGTLPLAAAPRKGRRWPWSSRATGARAT